MVEFFYIYLMDVVLDYIYGLEGNQRELMLYLHELLIENPGVVARIRYKIPFYDRNSWVCYLNPRKGDKVELVFTSGSKLSNEQGLLESRGRKMVRGIEIGSIDSMPDQAVREVIAEALVLDEVMPYSGPER